MNDELRAMQRLVQDAWALVGSRNRWHVGDVAWQHGSGGSVGRRQLWEEDGRVVAWGWGDGSYLGWQVDPRRVELLDEMFDAFEPDVTTVLASETAAIEILERRGYRADEDRPWFAYMQRELESLPPVEMPDGYEVRVSRGLDELVERTAVHRAAWEPSQMNEEKMRTVMTTWPYRADLDCIAVAPDGTLASSTLAWYDDENRVGEFEPVGTPPAHRRRGIGRAVNAFTLHQLRDAGAELAVVYCRGDAAYPIPKLLYESVGFRQHDRTIPYVKS